LPIFIDEVAALEEIDVKTPSKRLMGNERWEEWSRERER
jgi:hypothetical protein